MDSEPANFSWQPGVTLGCGLAYALFFFFNQLLFDRLEFASGVNWIFLPSGLRLALVLVFLGTGSLGIALASFAINVFFYGEGTWGSAIVGLISGYAPWLARRLSISWFDLDPDIRHLHPLQLLKISVVFALCSALLHQLWFAWNTSPTDFIEKTLVMTLGDLLGTLIILISLRLLLMLLRSGRVNT